MSGTLKTNKQGKAPQTTPSKSGHPDTPLNTPTQVLSVNAITPDHIQQFLDILKQATGEISSSSPKASPSEKNKDGTKPIRASKPEIASVYQFWNKSTGKYDIKDLFDSSDEDDRYVEYVAAYREKYDSQQVFLGNYLDIKSTTLRDTLRRVLEGVTYISLREDKPSVNPNVLFTYLHQLEAYRTNTKLDSTEVLHLDTLVEFLTTHYASPSQKLTALLEHNEITFELLPLFFRPNSVVYMVSADSEKPRCLMFDSGLVKAYGGKTYFELTCRYLTHDGKCFREATTTTRIAEFHGVMKITSLGVYPLEYHAEKESVTKQLTERGRKFISLNRTFYRKYEGMAFFINEKKETKKFTVSGRVMVDAVSFRERYPNYFFPKVDERSPEDDLFPEDDSPEDDSRNDREVTKKRTSYTPEDLLLCSPTVYGFCFHTKRWGELSVDDIEEITWDSLAFHSLVLPESRKEIIQSLVERHTNVSNDHNGKSFNDIIQGKGQGLVVLLHGPPGVGKTLTAEGIAEMKQLPLYNLCAGDLGTDAEKLERNLVEITSLAYKWGAIILIDEADVYLAERSLQEIQRNGLVSVFLRHLEHFRGIMFLTTNRLPRFDDAFQSRIHFAMKFGNLTVKAKKAIWKTFLEKVPTEVKISEEEIGDLSRKDLNGRQIKNIIRTGWDLASWKQEHLSIGHLKTALEAGEKFEVDFKGAGSTDQMRAYL